MAGSRGYQALEDGSEGEMPGRDDGEDFSALRCREVRDGWNEARAASGAASSSGR